MRIDGTVGMDLASAGVSAAEAEKAGYDGVWSVETGRDPFFPLVLAAEATESVQLGTGIAVAFARNPMNMAMIANDLHGYSKGRMLLGLGSQIKPHITKRYSMPWSKAAARIREYVLAMRAIWANWNEGTKLDFQGDFYTHTLMTPFFSPGPNPYGVAKVFLAGVGPLMTEVAGEVCDGFLCHPFTTDQYIREVTMPALEAGFAKGGRSRDDFEISGTAFVVTGRTEADMTSTAQAVKAQIAFYGSTPAYSGVLELAGYDGLQPELNALSKQGQWAEMANLIDDDLLHLMAVVAEPDDVAAALKKRWSGSADRLSFYASFAADPDLWGPVIQDLKAP